MTAIPFRQKAFLVLTTKIIFNGCCCCCCCYLRTLLSTTELKYISLCTKNQSDSREWVWQLSLPLSHAHIHAHLSLSLSTHLSLCPVLTFSLRAFLLFMNSSISVVKIFDSEIILSFPLLCSPFVSLSHTHAHKHSHTPS